MESSSTLVVADPDIEKLMEYYTQQKVELFDYAHLKGPLAEISKPCGDLAFEMVALLPTHPELVEGLRYLLQAKDAFVRARVIDLKRKAAADG